MIENSFIFLSGIGEKTETRLWKRGITSWSQYTDLPDKEVPKRVRRHRKVHARHLGLAREALAEEDLSPFARWLPSSEAWRAFEAAGDRVLYLDIETTGLAYPEGRTTVVGGHMPATGTQLLVKDQDLSARSVQAMLDEASLLVTFNGKQFDIPFLQKEFDVTADHLPHLDLRFALKKVGITGGLKKIEHKLGIAREDEVAGMDGYEAVLLWKRWERGEEAALDKLLAYNREDVVNMEPLARIAYDKLRQETFEACCQIA
ncbi:MAG: ribonuclease H-like domain-containing protein, partial [Candidatus Thermoplasmatota archaeon]|nr:ribonuclease H-like domain-containing protein [Candidatus Thermoplasmatota archaeon]